MSIHSSGYNASVSLNIKFYIIVYIFLVALGSTQPLTEVSTMGISWGVKAAGA